MATKTDLAEKQILEKQKAVDYDVKEFTIEILLQKFIMGMEEDNNEIFIPQYQRAFVWDLERQSKFIESILLGLPIPYIFTADNDDGRLEIIDGSQRIRTIERFVSNKLCLAKMEELDKLNGFYFKDLSIARQRKFKNASLRMIVLSDKSDEGTRFMLFERINRGSDTLKFMEKRKGIYPGKFTDFIYKDCRNNQLYVKLTKFTEKVEKRGEAEELILRFFAYSHDYPNFKSSVQYLLDDFVKKMNKNFNKKEFQNEFENMLQFVNKYMPNAFTKHDLSNKTPRVRFEAISVGVALALRINPNLKVKEVKWLDSKEFEEETTGPGTNTPSKVKSRIDYVRDKLLGKK